MVFSALTDMNHKKPMAFIAQIIENAENDI